jgi:hypothetical protein
MSVEDDHEASSATWTKAGSSWLLLSSESPTPTVRSEQAEEVCYSSHSYGFAKIAYPCASMWRCFDLAGLPELPSVLCRKRFFVEHPEHDRRLCSGGYLDRPTTVS